jgi:hypothetical protein
MIILKYWKTFIFAFILFYAGTGCTNHYNTKPLTRTSAYPRFIERAILDKRNFILHSGVDIYSITSVEIDKAKKHMTVHLDKLDSLNKRPVNNTEPVGSEPKKGVQSMDKIHVYMRDSTSYTLDEPHTILLNKISRIEEVN